MYYFSDLRHAASFALRCSTPAFVYDGPEENYVVALGREARQLEDDGHVPYPLAAVCAAGKPLT